MTEMTDSTHAGGQQPPTATSSTSKPAGCRSVKGLPRSVGKKVIINIKRNWCVSLGWICVKINRLMLGDYFAFFLLLVAIIYVCHASVRARSCKGLLCTWTDAFLKALLKATQRPPSLWSRSFALNLHSKVLPSVTTLRCKAFTLQADLFPLGTWIINPASEIRRWESYRVEEDI